MTRTAVFRGHTLGLLLFLAAGAANAWARQEQDATLSPYFFIQDGDASVDAFPLEATRVAATVNGVIADVFVTQVYKNEGSRPINGRYVFPGSTRAAVHGMVIRVGDQQVVARIRQREQARREFETAKARGRSASLLEQRRPNVFTMSVANIMPGDRVEVELHYTELLLPTEGVYRFVYPTVVAPRYGGGTGGAASAGGPSGTSGSSWTQSPTLRRGLVPDAEFEIRVTLATGMPLQEIESSSHEVIVSWHGEANAEVTLADSDDYAGDRDFILDYRLAGREIQTGLLLYRAPDENFFLMMLEPPERVPESDVTPREYVFILDVSGSMDGFPLQTGKTLIADLIRSLRPSDRFNVVLFAGGSQVLSGYSLPATPDNIAAATGMIGTQRGGGGTELLPALRTALSLPRDEAFSRTVVVITDGLVAVEPEAFDLVRGNLDRTNVFTFGIGSSVNRYLIEGLARAGAGEPFVVTGPEEAPVAARRFRDYVDSPVLTGVKVAFEGFDAYDVEPAALPDLFAERPVVVFGKWRGDPSGRIELSGRSAHGFYSRSLDVSAAAAQPHNAALRYLWARARVARLTDGSAGIGPDAAAAEITTLGLTYSLLTKHTSFIAVLEKIRNESGSADEVVQPVPLAKGLSGLAVGAGYTMGDEPGLALLAAALTLILSVAVLRRAVSGRHAR